MNKIENTAEYVSLGHPDKVADYISSYILDRHLEVDKDTKYAVEVIKKLLPLCPGTVTNINVPRLSFGKPKGVKVVPQSTKGFDEHYVREKTSAGQTIFQLAGGKHRPEEELADTVVLIDGFITVTPLHFDMTDYERMHELEQMKW